MGEWPGLGQNLIPLVLDAAIGARSEIGIFGTDYPTPDGTPVRDYIHVSDLATAHVLALKKLLETNKSNVYNLGNGKGFSVREVITAIKKVTGRKFTIVETDRRAGDPAILVALSDKIKSELGWQPQYPEIAKIVESAWRWHQRKAK